jgi:hypothetical protein
MDIGVPSSKLVLSTGGALIKYDTVKSNKLNVFREQVDQRF